MKPVEIPAELRGRYALAKPMYGGPEFVVHTDQGPLRINFATLTVAQAERLIRMGWTGICRVVAPVEPAFVEESAEPRRTRRPVTAPHEQAPEE